MVLMNINEYAIKIYNKIITAVGFNIDDIATCYPGAESITLSGTHSFIGDGTAVAQSLTKATPVTSSFTGASGSSSGSSHDAIPGTADFSVAKPVSVAFVGPATASSWIWEVAGFTSLYDQSVTFRFENAGTYVIKLTCASDGGQAAPHYMKITVT